MRKILLAAVALLVGAGQGNAATYQLTYTSSKLLSNPPYKVIQGATRLTFVFTSPTPFPRDTCFGLNPTSFSDGVDTLDTLAAAGYTDEFSLPYIQCKLI